MEPKDIVTPVAYRNPFSGQIESMPVAMVSAYVPYGTDLNLEDAARVAAIRDAENALNLEISVIEQLFPEVLDETTTRHLAGAAGEVVESLA